MIVLGLTRPAHDPAAALLVDGRVAAAAEEERFTRQKHGTGSPPLAAARFCLDRAGVKPGEVDVVAYPWSHDAYLSHRWTFARNHIHMPRAAFRALWGTVRRKEREEENLASMLDALGFDAATVRVATVGHHLSHVASAFFFSGMAEAACLSVDAMGEFDTMLLAEGGPAGLRTVKRYFLPQSLGTFYTAFTEYLGLGANDGEYKLMGMAPYGDASTVDLAPIVEGRGTDFRVDPRHVFPPSRNRGTGRYYSRFFEQAFGPSRVGDGLDTPYVDIAAAVQERLEEILLAVVRDDLGAAVKRAGGNLCLAGGVALNVRAVGRLLREGAARRVFVQPAAGDAGGALGAAAWAAHREGERMQPMETAYLGPAYAEDDLARALGGTDLAWDRPEDLAARAADLLARGDVVARFDGPMEWGPRALGNRSILAHPGFEGIADRVNETVKFREPWRPFCPTILADVAEAVLGTDHPSPWMTVAFSMKESWREMAPEVVHVDGTTRPQVLAREQNPGYYDLVKAFHDRTGLPMVLNTSFNRRGEPIVCTPADALRTFRETGLAHMIMGPFLVRKA